MADPHKPYAEVIGDPIDHSLSPLIHRFWLDQLGVTGDYHRKRCRHGELSAYLTERMSDPAWRGCNVTMPLKEEAARLLPSLDQPARSIGAVNCIARLGDRLLGLNTDVEGVAAALAGTELAGQRAVVIGTGGAARAAVSELSRRGANITILARSAAKAEPLRELAEQLTISPFAAATTIFPSAATMINATPLGMRGETAMAPKILTAFTHAPRGALAFDMVYRPLATPFLAAAEAAGLRSADGLTMLIGQARRPFELFFGAPAPAEDAELRFLLLHAADLP